MSIYANFVIFLFLHNLTCIYTGVWCCMMFSSVNPKNRLDGYSFIHSSFVWSDWFCLRYLSPCLIVVQVHQPAGVFLDLTGIYKASRELHAVLNIGRAASPLPALLLVVVALLLAVTAALAEVALATSCGHCVSNSGCGYGISECCLPAA